MNSFTSCLCRLTVRIGVSPHCVFFYSSSYQLRILCYLHGISSTLHHICFRNPCWSPVTYHVGLAILVISVSPTITYGSSGSSFWCICSSLFIRWLKQYNIYKFCTSQNWVCLWSVMYMQESPIKIQTQNTGTAICFVHWRNWCKIIEIFLLSPSVKWKGVSRRVTEACSME